MKERLNPLTVMAQATNPPPLSLRDYSLIKVTTLILENREVNDLLKQCNYEGYSVDRLQTYQKEEWSLFKMSVFDIVINLGIQETLIDEIMHSFKKLAINKLRWMRAYATTLLWKPLQNFTWTDRGNIDGHKTVKTLIKNSCFAIEQRFELACVFFLVNEARQLWQEMSSNQKSPFLSEFANPIVRYLLPDIQDTSVERRSLQYKDILENGLSWEALKYYKGDKKLLSNGYFKFLTNALDKHLFYEEEITHTCLWLLNQLDDRTKMGFFHKYPALLLCCFSNYIDVKSFKKLYQANKLDLNQHCKLFMHMFYKFHHGGRNYSKFGICFLEVFRMMSESDRAFLQSAGYGTYWASVLIKSHFPIVLTKGGFQKIARFVYEKLESSPNGKRLRFKREMWYFFKFLLTVKLTSVRDMWEHKGNALKVFGLSDAQEDEFDSAILFMYETSKRCRIN